MTTSSVSGGNILRITGMASGLDVDSMVKKLMDVEQIKVDKEKQKQQTMMWKQEAYQDVIKDVKDLQSTFFDYVGNNSNYMMSNNTYSPYEASNISVPTAVSITAGVTAQPGNYSISFMGGQLASSATITGSQLAIGTNGKTKLSDLGMGDINFDLTYNGKIKNISLKSTDTLSDVVNNINNSTGGAVVAQYSELSRQLTIKTYDTGSNTSINISGDIDGLGLAAGQQNGKDAIVTITPPSGAPATVTKSSNIFTIDGVSYNLQTQNDTTFTLSQNTQKVYDKIKGFLDKYNAIVDKIQTKLTEKKQYDYAPLTDTQKESMKDTEITAWETKAKQGILKGDSNLQKLLDSLRQAFSTGVSNTGVRFGNIGSTSIGLDTSKDASQGGKIFIMDEKKLKDAIAQHGDQVYKLFANLSSSSDASTQYKENGIFTRISDIITQNVGNVGTTLNSAILTKYANYQDDFTQTGYAGTNTLPDQIYRQNQIISKLNDSLSAKQEQYYNQFSKLESVMNQYNSQQSWLSQQFK